MTGQQAPLRLTTHRWCNASKIVRGLDGEQSTKRYKKLANDGPLTQYEYGTDSEPNQPGDYDWAVICAPHTGVIGIGVDREQIYATTRTARLVGRADAWSAVPELGRYHIAVDARGVPEDQWPVQGKIGVGRDPQYPDTIIREGADIKSNGWVPLPGSRHWSGGRYERVFNAHGNVIVVPATPELIDAINADRAEFDQANREARTRVKAGQNRLRASQGLSPLPVGDGDDGGGGNGHDGEVAAHVLGWLRKAVNAGRDPADQVVKKEIYSRWLEVAVPQDPSWPYTPGDFERHYGSAMQKIIADPGTAPAAGVAALTQQQQTAQQDPAELTGTVVQVPQVVFPRTGLDALSASRWVLGQGPLMWGIDNQLWAYQGGVWVPGEDPAGDIVHARCARLLGNQYRQAHESNTKEMIRAQVRTLRCDPVPGVINFRDGLLHWRESDQLVPHDPAVLTTVQLAVRWNPAAACPAFDAFLAGVVAPGDVPRMWEVIGYLMLSGNPLHKIFLLYGRGFNGKGTLLRAITAMLGEASVSSVSLHSLADERFTRAGLVGKLANVCGDIDATYIERTGLLKQLTGEDLITAEHKFRKPLQFTNWAVPVFSANEMPTSSDTSPGWRKRWEVFTFPNTFAPDPAFEQALMATGELEGIAAHGVRALRELMGSRPLAFTASAAGEDARKQFAASQDPLVLWLSENTVREQGAWTDQRHAHRDYKDWCEQSANRHPAGKLKFYTLMRERFPNTVRDGYPGFEGLALRSGPQSATQRNDLPWIGDDGQAIYPGQR